MKATRILLIALTCILNGISPAQAASDYVTTVKNTPNLLGYWRFSAASQANSEVNGHTGTLNGGATIGAGGSGPTLSVDPANSAASLNGTSSFVNTSLTGQVGSQGSIVGWFRLSSLPSSTGHIYYIAGQSQATNDFDLQIETDNKLKFYTAGGGSTTYSTTFTAADLNVWHFFAATFGASGTSIYLDGALVASGGVSTRSTSSGAFTMGASSVFGGRFFHGQLDEMALFNRQLSAGEVSTIYSSRNEPTVDILVPGVRDGDSSDDFGITGITTVGTSSAPLVFTITNTGSSGNLTGLTITKDGPNAAEFAVSAVASNSVAPGASTTFTITFNPSAPGIRTAAIHIASNVFGSKNPYDITLNGTANARPVVTPPPSPLIVEATGPNPDAATVEFTVTAFDLEDGTLPPPVSVPASGSTFPLGDTTVTAFATDINGATGTASFVVRVRDTTAPTITVPPSPVTASTDSPTGTAVTFSVSASDLVSGSFVPVATPASGSVFPLGDTTVNVTATDGAGNTATSSFTVTVTGSPIMAWRQSFFGTAANSGNTADTADFDLDGVKNLIEYAFATDPTSGVMGSLIVNGAEIVQHGSPIMVPNGPGFNAVFARRLNRIAAGLTYTVEFSANLSDWEASNTTPAIIATDAELDVVSVPFPAQLVSGLAPKYFRVAVATTP